MSTFPAMPCVFTQAALNLRCFNVLVDAVTAEWVQLVGKGKLLVLTSVRDSVLGFPWVILYKCGVLGFGCLWHRGETKPFS